MVWSCENFDQRSSSSRQKQCLKSLSKLCILARTGRIRSLHIWYILRPNSPPKKTKILVKNKNPAKSTFLGLLNNIIRRFRGTFLEKVIKNYRILVKLSKKNQRGSKMGLNWQLGPRQRVIRNSQIAYNRTIRLYFVAAKFQLLGVCCSGLYPEYNPTFFGSHPIGPIFGCFGALTQVKKRQIELKFWQENQVVFIYVQLPYKRFCKNSNFCDHRTQVFWSKIFGPILTPAYYLKMAEIAKIK